MEFKLVNGQDMLKSVWSHRLRMERQWLSEQRTGIRQGTRKLVDYSRSVLTNNANRLARQVNEWLRAERLDLARAKTSLEKGTRSLLKAEERIVAHRQENLKNRSLRLLSDRNLQRCQFQERLVMERFRGLFQAEQRRLKQISGQLRRVFQSEIRLLQERLSAKQALLTASDPKTALGRGCAIVRSEQGRVLKSVQEISEDDIVETEMKDGRLKSRILRLQR